MHARDEEMENYRVAGFCVCVGRGAAGGSSRACMQGCAETGEQNYMWGDVEN